MLIKSWYNYIHTLYPKKIEKELKSQKVITTSDSAFADEWSFSMQLSVLEVDKLTLEHDILVGKKIGVLMEFTTLKLGKTNGRTAKI